MFVLFEHLYRLNQNARMNRKCNKEEAVQRNLIVAGKMMLRLT